MRQRESITAVTRDLGSEKHGFGSGKKGESVSDCSLGKKCVEVCLTPDVRLWDAHLDIFKLCKALSLYNQLTAFIIVFLSFFPLLIHYFFLHSSLHSFICSFIHSLLLFFPPFILFIHLFHIFVHAFHCFFLFVIYTFFQIIHHFFFLSFFFIHLFTHCWFVCFSFFCLFVLFVLIH